ncbi:MAG: hypothetical protein GX109_01970 [Bacteroidales bacterium]|jgi:hypothetical protein|nr:hypothetical protein [Bacteroidales bacterium]
MKQESTQQICNQLHTKSILKISVSKKAEKAFYHFKFHAQNFEKIFKEEYPDSEVCVLFENKHTQSFYLQFGSDILLFMLHSNVFAFNRDHEVMKTAYIKEDKNRAYCGQISIYNFLTDSLFYQRYNDLGYLIGRVFVNNDNHYYIDGKREIGQLYNNFGTNVFDEKAALMILESAMQYTINFDLLVTPYEAVKEISVHDMVEINNQRIPIRTAKRLGFRFQADTN